MKIIGIIPSRYGSSRFPGKPLAQIKGKSMIQRVYEQIRNHPKLSDVIVATDDERIYDHVSTFGKAMMTATTHTNGTERCAEVASALELNEEDIVINVQGDEPFVHETHVNSIVSLMQKQDVLIGTLVKKEHDTDVLNNTSVSKAVIDLQGRALYFSRYALPFNRDGINGIPYYKHLGIYGYQVGVLHKLAKLTPTPLEQAESHEQLRWIEHGYSIHTIETHISNLEIDTPEDLKKIEALFS